LFITLPFSLEILVTSSSKMSFPSEIILVLLFFIFIYHLLELPSQKWQLFYTNLFKFPLVISSIFFLLVMVASSYFSTMPEVSIKFTLINILFVSVGFGYTFLALMLNKIKVREIILAATFGLSMVCVYTLFHSFFLGFGRNV